MLFAVHRIASVLATLTIATFFASTLVVELAGDPAVIAQTKALIVTPGLFILIPALMATGGSGFALARGRSGRLVAVKKRRMPVIVALGVLVLLPSALVLARWSAAGRYDTVFYALQALELLAGAVNLTLMVLNARDGLRLAGRLRAPAGAAR